MSNLIANGRYFVLAASVLLAACASPRATTHVIDRQEAWTGPVFVTEAQLPSSVSYRVVGTVQVNATSGYNRVEALYPRLAREARALGANAVMGTKGGRSLTAFSWSAPNVGGTAVRVENLDRIKGVDGAFH